MVRVLALIVLLVGAYLVGSIPVGLVIGRSCGFDPRATGSGNIGMTNVARSGGMGAAGLTFAGDVLKGFVPVIAARWAGFGTVAVAGTGLAAALGAMWSIFLGFRGGRGVSAGLGVWLGISPVPVLIAVAVFAAVFAATRIVSLGSISAAIALVPAAAALGVARPYLLLAIVMSALVLVRHRANIGRLIRGEEPTFRIGHAGPQ